MVRASLSPVQSAWGAATRQRGKAVTVDEAVIGGEGRYRFKKREFTNRGGRAYYLQAVPKKRWADKKVPEWTAALDDDRAD